MCADASSMNVEPLSSSCCIGSPVSWNIVPSSRTTVRSFSLSTESTNEFSSTSRSPSSTGSDAALPCSVSPSSAYGGSSSAGSKSRYCSPTAERLCTYIGASLGSSVPSSSARSRMTPSGVAFIWLTLPIFTPR